MLKKTYFCLHALCVRNKYPADDSTILCVIKNALGGFTFYTEGGRLAPCYDVTPYGLFHAIIAVTQ